MDKKIFFKEKGIKLIENRKILNVQGVNFILNIHTLAVLRIIYIKTGCSFIIIIINSWRWARKNISVLITSASLLSVQSIILPPEKSFQVQLIRPKTKRKYDKS